MGATVAVAALLAVLGGALSGHGGDIGRAVHERIRSAVLGEPSGSGPVRASRSTPRAKDQDFGGAWRDAQEQRWSTGTDAPRVSRNDLRFEPIVPGWSMWSTQREGTGSVAGVELEGSASICALCADAGWRDSLRLGITGKGGSGGASGSGATGIGVEAEIQGRAAVLSAELLGHAGRVWHRGAVDVRGRVQGTIGVDLDGRVAAHATPTGGEAEARGGAMAGAAIRGEARAGVTLLGIALTTTTRGEGWAGAGARGRVGAKLENGAFSWNVGGGAALGFGGAAEWGGTVDVSKLPARHREVATSTARLALGAIVPGFATNAITSLSTTKRHREE